MKKLAILAVLAFAACDGQFAIVPSASAAVPDQVLQLALSQAVPGVTWTATAGTITSSGLFTAPGCTTALPQTVTVTASAGGFTATATVAVSDPITGIAVNPPTASIGPLATTQFTATVKSFCNPTGTLSVLKVPAPAALRTKK